MHLPAVFPYIHECAQGKRAGNRVDGNPKTVRTGCGEGTTML